ncbi:exo-alpha-sialidase [Halovulum dunhuangense]|uniref:Exo-alpha-sialidase n=1 Tax=Halovulum dunhuangense TaxID=1505036 RepID=A0A849L588_9RHOB|nr:exo-alpha-sialidase [Halovulum dunhuangense]NNU81344.1 exo-alpha-sialidase [Halovulum dunhuangense]
MSGRIHLLIGTTKGAFVLDGDAGRRDWAIRGPFCDGWPINHVIGDPETGVIHAAGGSPWHGIGVWRSDDLGGSWRWSGEGIHAEERAAPIDSVWSLGRAPGRLYAGTRPAELFESRDGGETWARLDALTAHPSRAHWHPGGAGLTLHHIVTDPGNPGRIWVGISSAGVFASEDGGASWEPRNMGVRNDYAETEAERCGAPYGQCVHGLALGPGGVMYQQNHCGMYRSLDAGRSWQSIEAGLPSSFGFPVGVHPRDPGVVWLVPMNGDVAGRYMPGAAAAVWRSMDGGATWAAQRRGLPQEHCYFTVLRQALAVDDGEPAGVYFGTNAGSIHASADEGESWVEVARNLPTVLSVEVMRLGG